MAAGVLVGSCIMGHTAWNLRSELKNFIEKGGQSYEEKMKEQGNLIWIVHQASGKIGIIIQTIWCWGARAGFKQK